MGTTLRQDIFVGKTYFHIKYFRDSTQKRKTKFSKNGEIMKNLAIFKENIREVDDIRETDFTKNKTNLSKDSVCKNFLL